MELGFRRVVVQAGKSLFLAGDFGALSAAAGLEGAVYDYKPSLAADIAAADLVISHAGSA